MKFAEIFDKWERGKQLQNNKIFDKDAEAESNEPGFADKRRLRSKKPDDVLDIHGLTRDEAWISLDRFFENARSLGFEKLRIIHGKGNHSKEDAVLKRCVREFIEKCPNAGESGYEKASGGGTGATWVLLKDRK
jgi:DNA-nicking Smr family endonuclease